MMSTDLFCLYSPLVTRHSQFAKKERTNEHLSMGDHTDTLSPLAR